MCVTSGAVDGGEAEISRQSVRRLRGASVSAVPRAAGLGAGEGGCYRPAGAAAGGAGKTHKAFHQSNRSSASGRFLFFYFQVQKNVEEDVAGNRLHTHTKTSTHTHSLFNQRET